MKNPIRIFFHRLLMRLNEPLNYYKNVITSPHDNFTIFELVNLSILVGFNTLPGTIDSS